MFKFIFEIYDKRCHLWYQDFVTYDLDVAEDYFDYLSKIYDKGCIRMTTIINENKSIMED